MYTCTWLLHTNLNVAFKGKNDEHYQVRNISRMMNVASARNCVSASHFAAATCHYCTITVCTTIVASRTSFVQSDLIILANLVFRFSRSKEISLILYRVKNCMNIIYTVKIEIIESFPLLYFTRRVNRIFSPPLNHKFPAMKPRILCASPTLYIESYYTR